MTSRIIALPLTMAITSLLVASSCGGSSTTGGDSGNGVNGACIDGCRAAKCQASGCGEGCMWRCVRDEYMTAVIACLNDPALACDAKADDNCGAKAAQALAARPGETDFVTACLKRRSECGSSFSDDNCGGARLLNDACFAQAKDCLAKPCAEVAGCIRPLYE